MLSVQATAGSIIDTSNAVIPKKCFIFFIFVLQLIDYEFQPDTELRMKTPRRVTPEDAFAPGEQQHHTVGQVGFQFQRDSPAVDKCAVIP